MTELEQVKAFLRQIGLEVVDTPGASGFVPGVRVIGGVLHVDDSCRPSALLHEAGHVSIMPGQFRRFLDDDLRGGIKRMFAVIRKLGLDPDAPLGRAAGQCSDPEATAWAWAAGLAVGLAPESIIMDDEYQNDGAGIRQMLMARQYCGINGLRHAGLCKHGFMVSPEVRYPNMTVWVQPHL